MGERRQCQGQAWFFLDMHETIKPGSAAAPVRVVPVQAGPCELQHGLACVCLSLRLNPLEAQLDKQTAQRRRRDSVAGVALVETTHPAEPGCAGVALVGRFQVARVRGHVHDPRHRRVCGAEVRVRRVRGLLQDRAAALGDQEQALRPRWRQRRTA
jgi:hypothetical protein